MLAGTCHDLITVQSHTLAAYNLPHRVDAEREERKLAAALGPLALGSSQDLGQPVIDQLLTRSIFLDEAVLLTFILQQRGGRIQGKNSSKVRRPPALLARRRLHHFIPRPPPSSSLPCGRDLGQWAHRAEAGQHPAQKSSPDPSCPYWRPFSVGIENGRRRACVRSPTVRCRS